MKLPIRLVRGRRGASFTTLAPRLDEVARPGELTALIGAERVGKTSVLNGLLRTGWSGRHVVITVDGAETLLPSELDGFREMARTLDASVILVARSDERGRPLGFSQLMTVPDRVLELGPPEGDRPLQQLSVVKDRNYRGEHAWSLRLTAHGLGVEWVA